HRPRRRGVMAAWRPARRDGWWPQITVVQDRILVAYGNTRLSVTELRWTGTALAPVEDREMRTSGWRSRRWLRPGVATAWRERPDIGRSAAERGEMDWTAGERTIRVVSPKPSNLIGGNTLRAADGHVAEFSAGRYI